MATIATLKAPTAKSAAFTDNLVLSKIVEAGELVAKSASAWPNVFMTVTELAANGKLSSADKTPTAAVITGKAKKGGGAKRIIDDAYHFVEGMKPAFADNAGFGLKMADTTADKAKSEMRLAIRLGELETVGVNGVALLASTAAARTGDSKQVYECFKSVAAKQIEQTTKDKAGKVIAAVPLTKDDILTAITPTTNDATAETIWIGIGATLKALIAGSRKDGVKENDAARRTLAAQIIALAGNLKDDADAAKEAKLLAENNAKRDKARAEREAAAAAAAAPAPAKAPAKAAPAKSKAPTKRGK
jgi:hypothetical protein